MSNLVYKAVATESPTSVSDDSSQNFAELKQITPVHPHQRNNYLHQKSHQQTHFIEFNEKKREIKRWQEFPGRNSFFCDGMVMMSHQRGVFYVTLLLIITTSTLFFIFDCPYLSTQVSVSIPIIGALLLLFVLGTLLRTSGMDPGVIPRADKYEASLLSLEVAENEEGERSFKAPPRTRQLIIRGRQVNTKYCFTCKIFRPPRASHCSVCDNCVERFDHHCPWVGNCVGVRNYRYFYLFLLSLSFLSSFIFSTCLYHIYSC